MSSSDWLGFSLTPHLRIDNDGDQDQDQNQVLNVGGGNSFESQQHHQFSSAILPLHSDGSLSFHGDWRYENGESGSEEGPKLEDFLGSCCYSANSPPPPPPQPPSSSPTPPLSPYFNHQLINPPPQTLDMYNNNNNNITHVPFDGCASSISGFKSWLRQNPLSSNDHQANNNNNNNNTNITQSSSLSLTMSHSNNNNNNNPLQMVAVEVNRKRSTVTKSSTKEAVVPRKSIDTFGQRTSQYRGVTRYVLTHNLP
ncbi:hypothetical protein ACFE04_008393 [Oxalis oulophora]